MNKLSPRQLANRVLASYATDQRKAILLTWIGDISHTALLQAYNNVSALSIRDPKLRAEIDQWCQEHRGEFAIMLSEAARILLVQALLPEEEELS
jgi:hypothetical protein